MAEHCKISAALVAEERSYMLKIHGYSRAKALLKNGEFMISTPFSVGGYNWAVEYFPNGHSVGPDFISVFLVLVSADAKDVEVKFRFSLLDKNGKPEPSFNNADYLKHSTTLFTSKDPGKGYLDFVERTTLERSAYLKDDCLTIRCDVTVMMKNHSKEHSVDVPPSDLHQHLGDLLNNKDAADLIFQVGGERFFAHRCVLSARSSVFKAELLGAMKENSGSPIEICDMEADVFKSFLHFIYTDTVPPVLASASNKGTETRGDLVMAGHLLVAADRYNIGRLKLICEEKLCSQIDSDMVATTLALAEQHGSRVLKEACLEFLGCPSNLEAMMASEGFEHLKSSCPSVLKELLARFLPAELKAAKDLLMAI